MLAKWNKDKLADKIFFIDCVWNSTPHPVVNRVDYTTNYTTLRIIEHISFELQDRPIKSASDNLLWKHFSSKM